MTQITTPNKGNLQVPEKSLGLMQEIARGGADSILASLWRIIIYQIGVDENRWHQLMNAYLNDPKNGIKFNHKDQSSARGNLHKELFKPKMSWKVFCKGMRFLNITKFKIIIVATHTNGKITQHERQVNLGVPLEIEEKENNETRS